jgi:hyaluronoglucosaminidase
VSGLARIVYVSNGRGDTVTPIAVATGTPGPPIPVGPAPGEIVVTPDGKTAYITTDAPVVVPIATATGTPGPPIRVGVNRPGAVVPFATATNTPESPIQVGDGPYAIAITP